MSNTSPKTYRFALCLSGGISLGVYIAGVLTQLYHDMHELNKQGNTKFVIDVIAGSSAGSITGLTLARALAIDADPIDLKNAMRDCWVSGLDVRSLLNPAEDAANAFFTSKQVQEVGKKVFAALPLPTDSEPTPLNTVALWMTMTNLDGIPYQLSFKNQGKEISFYARSYRDYEPYFISGKHIYHVDIPTKDLGNDDNPKWQGYAEWKEPGNGWADAQQAATISGAFPIAFQSHPHERDLSLYPEYLELKEALRKEAKEENKVLNLPDKATFQYVDGGLFNNQPIGRAIDAAAYVTKFDASRKEDPRTYLIIEPDPNTRQSIQEHFDQQDSTKEGLMPLQTIGSIFNAYFTDALYDDFNEALTTNQRIIALNEALEGLEPEQQKAIKKAVGYGHKEVIALERIPHKLPTEDRLAGDFAAHFGGFMDEELREADFHRGKLEGREWLVDWLKRSKLDEAATYLKKDAPCPLTDAEERLTKKVWMKKNPEDAEISEDRRDEIVKEALQRLEVILSRWLPVGEKNVLAFLEFVKPKIQESLVDKQPRGFGWGKALLRFIGYKS